jgi:CRISPR-associated protein Csh1
MNKIRQVQVDHDKSTTIIEKLNFDGIPVRRIQNLVNQITKYLNMRTYNMYHANALIHAAMDERLHGIEKSSLTKDEVVFYIMTGISLSSYLGYQHNQKQKNEDSNE